jgi:hypothetical protein
MIVGIVVECDVCGKKVSVNIGKVRYTVNGDTMEILDRWVCDECVKKMKGAA